MIVKTLRIKTKDFARLVHYIEDDKGRNQDNSPFDKDFRVFHNISKPDINGAIAALKANDKYRKVRKNSVVLYHEVLSFNPRDSKHITQPMVEDLAHKYIAIRAEHGVCFAKPHVHDKHLHIHFLFSGVELENRKTLRMDNKKFREVKLDIERHQQQKYPELKHSIVYLDKVKKKEKSNPKEKEFQTKKRLKKQGKLSKKEQVHELLQDALDKSDTLESFYNYVQEKQNLEVYKRKGKEEPNGIIFNGKKYRFSTALKGKWTDFKEQSKKYSDRMERIQSTRELEKEQELEKPISRTERLRQARQRGKENEGRTI